MNQDDIDWATKTLKKLNRLDIAEVFRQPVKELKKMPNYTEVVKRPIDLFIIQERVDENKYDDINKFKSDIKTMVDNCKEFNKNSCIRLLSDAFYREFIKCWCERSKDSRESVIKELCCIQSRMSELEAMLPEISKYHETPGYKYSAVIDYDFVNCLSPEKLDDLLSIIGTVDDFKNRWPLFSSETKKEVLRILGKVL